jgi:hypothetical protein
MSKVTDAIRARRERRRAFQESEVAHGLGHVRLAPKTKAELQDELTIAGIEFPKKATKAELEALSQPDVAGLVAEDLALAQDTTEVKE